LLSIKKQVSKENIMIITELSYQEIASEAENLEGGTDLSVNFTEFQQKTSILQSASTSGPGGSTSMSSGGSQKIDTLGLGAIVLGF
jgi:hypothetical protein